MIKIEKILFYVFLFLIPFQVRMFLDWSGNEWNSIFIYLGDVLLIAVFLLAVFRKGFHLDKKDIFLGAFLLIAAISLFVSPSIEIGVFRFIKLVEFIVLYMYIRSNLRELKLNHIFSVLIVSGLIQSILAIIQFLKQKSLDLKFIEAGVFIPGDPGVASFTLNGDKILRAYGSFPHPNVLAGFLLLCIFSLYYLFLKKRFNIFYILSYILLVFSLFLTFSRTAIILFLVISLIMFFLMIIKRFSVVKVFSLFVLSCLICVIILCPYLKARFLTVSLEEQALDLRFFYNEMAFTMIKEKPLLGIGIGNFVLHSQNYEAFLRAASKMIGSDIIPDWIYQPVHNIYLLILVETGIIGLLVFFLFFVFHILFRIKRLLSNPLLFLVAGFLIIGLIDHYFWTLHPGGIIFWSSLALLDL